MKKVIVGRAHGRQQDTPGALAAFARFVALGGGVGLASSAAVAALATRLPWALANALVTVVSTLLATELHARFTFGAGGRATWRQHTQSAGSAAAAYTGTCVAMAVLHQLAAAPGALLEQAVYLSASALAGVARFAVLRLVVFARGRTRPAETGRTGDADQTGDTGRTGHPGPAHSGPGAYPEITATRASSRGRRRSGATGKPVRTPCPHGIARPGRPARWRRSGAVPLRASGPSPSGIRQRRSGGRMEAINGGRKRSGRGFPRRVSPCPNL